MKFVADGMLGKLARWLRLAGHDVVYVGELDFGAGGEDKKLIEYANAKKRSLLTSDFELYKRSKKYGVKSFLIRNNGVINQLLEISRFMGQKIKIDFEKSRCPVCNGNLKVVGKKEVGGSVPEKVLKSHEVFWLCKKCGKAYWEGKHWKTIIDMASEYEKKVGSDVED